MGLIYRAVNTTNGKVYIGKTICSLRHRWRQHIYDAMSGDDSSPKLHRAIRKYGSSSFSVSVIENVDDSLLSSREIFWIKEYDAIRNGYNCTIGGDGQSFLDKEKIRELWDNGETVHNISSSLGCSRSSVARLLEGHDSYCPKESHKRSIHKDMVSQYDLNGRYIQSFESVKEASRTLGIHHSNITRSCKGKRNSAGGFQWRFGKCDSVTQYKKSRNSKNAVAQYNIDNNIVGFYDSIHDATKSTGVCYSSISQCCQKRQSTAGGFLWAFL